MKNLGSRRRIFLVAGMMFAMASAAPAENTAADWQVHLDVDVRDPGLVRFSVPLDLLDAAHPSFQDLRLFSSDGREIPFLLEIHEPVRRLWQKADEIDIAIEPARTVILLKCAGKDPAEAVSIESPVREFLKSARVEGSMDKIAWTPLARGRPVFRHGSGTEKLDVPVPPGVWTYLRISLDDEKSPPIAVTGAGLLRRVGKPPALTTVNLPVDLPIKGPDYTRLTARLPARNLVWSHFRLEVSDPFFMRTVSVLSRTLVEGEVREQSAASATIFRVGLEGLEPSSDLTLPLAAQVPAGELAFVVQDGDNPGLEIRGIQGFYIPVHLIFQTSRPGNFILAAGRPSTAAPRYDLAGLKQFMDPARFRPALLGTVRANPLYREPEVLPGLPSAGSEIDISAWKYRKALTLSGAGFHQLTLDLDAMSRADLGGRDIRLVSGKAQIPYILEKTGPIQSVDLVCTQAVPPQKEKSRISRWSLTSSHSRVPYGFLTCSVEETLFRRNVTLYEIVEDRRGEKRRRDLGRTVWTRTAESARGRMSIPVQQVPQGRDLVLEIEDEDNPPLTIRDVRGHYPSLRVAFKASGDSSLFLYYGNPVAAPPRYDIGLVAEKILAAKKSTVRSGPEEQLRRAAWWEPEESSRRTRILFWAALGIAAMVLLGIIVKLLPKDAAPPAGPGSSST